MIESLPLTRCPDGAELLEQVHAKVFLPVLERTLARSLGVLEKPALARLADLVPERGAALGAGGTGAGSAFGTCGAVS